MNKTLVISPSGKMYGSEQVLLDFLKSTKNSYVVAVPKGSIYEGKLNKLPQHKIIGFQKVIFLYVKVLFLLFRNKITTVYVNEGGHIKYIKKLAEIFPKKKFVVHIRLVEDTKHERIGQNLPDNIKLICVSEFIANEIINNHPKPAKIRKNVKAIWDAYNIQLQEKVPFFNMYDVISIGVVGRVCAAKGVSKILSICQYWEEEVKKDIEFNFFGDVVEDDHQVKRLRKEAENFNFVKLKFHGFVKRKEDIYGKVNMIIHFNNKEPFPRISFETISFGIPLISFNDGGVGEQAKIMEIQRFMCENVENWEKEMASIIQWVQKNETTVEDIIKEAKGRINTELSQEKYNRNLEGCFNLE